MTKIALPPGAAAAPAVTPKLCPRMTRAHPVAAQGSVIGGGQQMGVAKIDVPCRGAECHFWIEDQGSCADVVSALALARVAGLPSVTRRTWADACPHDGKHEPYLVQGSVLCLHCGVRKT